jgi:hypothetical protein
MYDMPPNSDKEPTIGAEWSTIRISRGGKDRIHFRCKGPFISLDSF